MRLPKDVSRRVSAAFTLLGPEYKERSQKYIGDDLTEGDLDSLYDAVLGSGPESGMYYWWRDKPHQIFLRLLARLTRAELRVKELEEALLKAIRELEKREEP